MFKNMKLATKLYSGFGITVVIAAVLGYMGWSSLGTVVARVENADGANQLLQFAKDCRIQEKNFIMRGDTKYQEENDETMGAIYKQADETKARFRDPADINTITEVKAKGETYKKSFDGWITLYDQQQEREKAMVDNAHAFVAECDAIRTDQKAKLAEDLQAAEDARADRLWKADSANRLIKLAQDCRIQEKNFIMREDKKYQQENDATMKEIYAQCDELAAKFNQQENKDQAAKVKSSAEVYKENFDVWITLWDQQQTQAQAMVDNARAFIDKCQALRQAQKTKAQQALQLLGNTSQFSRAHLNWAAGVREFLADKSQKALSVKTDGTKCGFGKWLASDEFKEQAQIAGGDFQDIVDRMRKDHMDLHASAIDIEKARQGNTDTSLETYNEKTAPILKRILAMFDELEANATSVYKTKLANADSANRLIRYALECRTQEKNFMLCGDKEYQQQNDKTMQNIYSECDELMASLEVKADDDAVVTIKQAAQKYKKGFDGWIALRDQQKTAETAMLTNARAFVAECDAMYADQEQKLAKANEEALAAITGRINKADDANRLIKWAKDCRIQEKSFILRGDKKYQVENDATMQNIYELCSDLNSGFKDQKNKDQIANILAAAKAYKSGYDGWVGLHEKQKVEEQTMVAAAQDFGKGADKLREGQHEKMSSAVAFSTQLMMFLAAGGVIIGIVLAFVITRGITKPINRIIGGLNEGSEQVNEAAGQVSTASQQLAEGASEQASSLEETSSALEQMAAMTRTNAENAKEANNLSDQAKTAAQSGDQTMHQLNDAMAGINDSSGKISKIIKVIEEIAFQTNLLALNAAVEAARAGEHGKGFAVVADEVRNLAQRSAQAAKETTALIEDSVNNAKGGTEVAGKVGKSLSAIVGDVAKVTDLIKGISKASEEQAQGVDQVNTAVSQMDKVTQQNAAGAEESASAAEQLSAQAQAVKGTINELMILVGGKGAEAGASTATTTAVKKKKHSNVKVAHIKRKGTSAEPVAADAPAGGSSDDFMSLDDDKNLNDF